MKEILVDRKQMLRLKRAVKDIKIDLHLFKFGMSSSDEDELYKRIVKETAKSLSIIDKMIRSNGKDSKMNRKLNGYVKFLITRFVALDQSEFL